MNKHLSSRKNSINASRQKKDTIVAVRMPRGLVEELKDLQKINHFMDISDEIRFVIRKNVLPMGVEKTDQELRKKEQLIQDLNRIITELKNEQ
jgi:hypothetical protein